MMSNPAMMQQSMQMAQQMFAPQGTGTALAQQTFGNQQGGGLGTTPTPAAPQMPVAAPNAVAPATANADPMAQMMQQMMSNPAMMQQSMQMAQQMFGNQGNGAGFPGMYGNFGAPGNFG